MIDKTKQGIHPPFGGGPYPRRSKMTTIQRIKRKIIHGKLMASMVMDQFREQKPDSMVYKVRRAVASFLMTRDIEHAAGVCYIAVKIKGDDVNVDILLRKPGVIIGVHGGTMDALKAHLSTITKKRVSVYIHENNPYK